MKISHLALAGLLALGLAPAASANDAGDRIDSRLDRRGDRIERRYDRRATYAEHHGHPQRAVRLERRGDRIDGRLDRRGDRIDRRFDRRRGR